MMLGFQKPDGNSKAVPDGLHEGASLADAAAVRAED